MDLRVGTCGWAFEDWRGPFYPPRTDELAFYAARFRAVEIDSTWYRIPTARTVESWRRRSLGGAPAPQGFLFCPKLPGEITHDRLLEGSADLVAQFLEVIALLGDRLGPILVQLSPHFDAGRLPVLAGFLRALPTDFRYAVEFRHRSWIGHEDVLALLAELGMAVAMADHPRYPRMEHVTADFAYLRLLGQRGVFPDYARTHSPRDEELAAWAGVLQDLPAAVTQAFVFINNQFEGHSPETVRKLLQLLGEDLPEPRDPNRPLTLFD